MRSASQRRADAVARLERDPNVWIATASGDGVPHLIPLSLCWDGRRLLLATPTDSPTVHNAAESGTVRAALDSTDDVVLIDATVEVVDFDEAAPDLVERYVERVGWNPTDEEGDWSLLVATPVTVRAWNGVAEIRGRTIMRNGRWFDADPPDASRT